jgi:hypothetical protein
MSRRSLMTLAVAGAVVVGAGCGRDTAARTAADSAGRDMELAPAPNGGAMNDRPAQSHSSGGSSSHATAVHSSGGASAPATAPSATLGSGTSFATTTGSEISSKTNKAGQTFTATVASAVKDSRGRTVIPAGAEVTFRIDAIHESENKSDNTGTLKVTPVSVSVGGTSYDIDASAGDLPTHLVSHGADAGDIAKVGAGAGIGAVAGRVLGGSTKGAVIGGVIGGAVGAQRMVETKDRAVVLSAGSKVEVTLTGPLTVKR